MTSVFIYRYWPTPWHALYFLPLPHGHGSLRPMFSAKPLKGIPGTGIYAPNLYKARIANVNKILLRSSRTLNASINDLNKALQPFLRLSSVFLPSFFRLIKVISPIYLLYSSYISPIYLLFQIGDI